MSPGYLALQDTVLVKPDPQTADRPSARHLAGFGPLAEALMLGAGLLLTPFALVLGLVIYVTRRR